MSDGALNYKLGGDSSELQKAFETGLRYAGDFVNDLKRAFSVRGIFDGLVGGLKGALGGNTFGDIFVNALKGSMAKEQLQQNFAGLLNGDEAKASALIDSLKAFGDDASIASKDLTDAAREMITAGGMSARGAVQDIKMLGEVSRATGRPIGELAGIWAKMFDTGTADERALNGLRGAGVSMQALADASGMALDEFLELGKAGELSFDKIHGAMKKLTESGIFKGQIERYKNTLGAIVDDTKDTFGKIPGAFFAGIIGAGAEGAKSNMRQIRDIIQGWVDGARELGGHFAAAMKVLAGMSWKDIGGLIYDAITGAFIGAMNIFATGLQAAISGFAVALDRAMDEVSDKLNPLGEHKPGAGRRIFQGFAEGVKGSLDDPTFPKVPNPGADSLISIFGHGMFWADGIGSTLAKALHKGIPEAMRNPEFALGGENAPGAGMRALAAKISAPDALSKIGLFVGSGGPQGERYAADTAKSSAKAAKHLENIDRKSDGKKGRTTFGGK